MQKKFNTFLSAYVRMKLLSTFAHMKNTKKLIIVSLLILVSTIISAQGEKSANQYIYVGDTAPDFTVEMLDGSKVSLSELRGKVVMLNFFATWCGPCMQEFRHIPDMIVNKFKVEKDFVLLPISRQEKKETVVERMKFLKTQGIDFPVGIDPERKIYSLYAKSYIPRNFIINKEGKVIFTSQGFSMEELEELVSIIEKELK